MNSNCDVSQASPSLQGSRSVKQPCWFGKTCMCAWKGCSGSFISVAKLSQSYKVPLTGHKWFSCTQTTKNGLKCCQKGYLMAQDIACLHARHGIDVNVQIRAADSSRCDLQNHILLHLVQSAISVVFRRTNRQGVSAGM